MRPQLQWVWRSTEGTPPCPPFPAGMWLEEMRQELLLTLPLPQVQHPGGWKLCVRGSWGGHPGVLPQHLCQA